MDNPILVPLWRDVFFHDFGVRGAEIYLSAPVWLVSSFLVYDFWCFPVPESTQ
jgi:hypothetical protein